MQNEELYDKLNDDIDMTFEDNILVKYAGYTLSPDLQVDPADGRRIYERYTKARLAYLRAVADLIENQDAIGDLLE